MTAHQLHPHPRSNALREWLRTHAEFLRPWAGRLFRFQTLAYPAPKDLLSGRGAKERGGRWNPPGLATLYGSTTDTTALEECKANDRYYGVVTTSPRLLVAIEARLDRVLDLSDVSIRRSLGVTLEELASEDWRKLLNAHRESFGQALGRAVAEAGGHGLLARSATVARGLNVAIFTQQMTTTTRLSVVEGEALANLAGRTKS